MLDVANMGAEVRTLSKQGVRQSLAKCVKKVLRVSCSILQMKLLALLARGTWCHLAPE